MHAAVVSPVVAPYVPAGHGAVQVASAMGWVDPYRPAAHAVHDPAPTSEYCPMAHMDCVADVDPAGHA